MKMKKSQARNLVKHVIERTFDPAPDGVEIILNAWEEAGVQWEPEEVELPERIAFKRGEHGWSLAVRAHDRPVLAPGLYREAAARYNAVNRCRREGRFGQFFDVLSEERERLQ